MRFLPLAVCLLAFQVQSQTITVNSYAFAAPSSLNVGLVSFWALEEPSGTRYDGEPTPGVMDLTDNNTVTNAPGIVGNAAFFIAPNGEFLSHADSPELSRGNFDWSLVAWSKATTLTGSMVIVSQWSVTPSQQRSWRLWFDSGAGKYTFGVSDNGINDSAELADAVFGLPVTNVWNFHVIIHDAVNNQLRISTNDGTPTTLGYSAGVVDSTAPFDIGARGFTPAADHWDGAIDQIGIWNRVLTAGEITTLYGGGTNPPPCCPFP
jgi:hypothetical protein